MNILPTCQQCGSSFAGASLDDSYCPACLLRETLLVSGPGPDSALASIDARVPRAFGAYELLEVIGRGGMGIVYRGRQGSLNRTVAIKLLAGGAHSSEASLRRF